jgi:hypothetical protein
MKKFAVIMILGLALLLAGLTLSAPAVTISDGINPSGEQDLYQVVAFMGGGNYADSQTFANANAISQTLSTIAVGGYYSYSLTGYFYTGAGYLQDPGTNAAGVALPITFVPSGLFPANGNQYVPLGGAIPLAPSTTLGAFGFADVINGGPFTLYTETLLNGAVAQSNGLIFQIGTTDQFIVAFEDGGGTASHIAGLGNLGDVDYNDLVLNVTRTFHEVPLPPSALLLGTGLLGLVGLRRLQKQA